MKAENVDERRAKQNASRTHRLKKAAKEMFANVVAAIQKFNASCAVAGYQALRKPKWQRKSIASGAGQGSCEPCQKKAQALQSWQKAVREARQDLGPTKDVVPRKGTEVYKRAKVLMLKHQSDNRVE